MVGCGFGIVGLWDENLVLEGIAGIEAVVALEWQPHAQAKLWCGGVIGVPSGKRKLWMKMEEVSGILRIRKLKGPHF